MLGDFSGNWEPVRIFYIEINGNFFFDLRIFTLWTVFIEQIMFINGGMGVKCFLQQNEGPCVPRYWFKKGRIFKVGRMNV
jgi:hypothetical protein